MRASAGCVSIGRQVDDAGSGIHSAVRELVGLLDRPDGLREPARENDASTEMVLLDVELDGLRYLLVRMPRHSQERLQLSPREYEIVRMVAKGHPNKVIADVLNISSWTVCTHLRRIFAKMGVGSRAAMVAQLLERGVVPNELRTHTVRRPVHSSESL
jgi:DNA-binding CsgD family transcriptional regulator